MANFVNRIYTVLHQQPESSYLVIEERGRGYRFSVSFQYDPQIARHSLRLFKDIFGAFHEGLQNTRLVLTKRAVREIFVEMARFNEQGAPLGFETFEEFQHVFLDQAPCLEDFIYDKARTSGQGFRGLCEKVFLQWQHYFTSQTETDPIKAHIRGTEFLTSRQGDREFQEGEIVYLGPDQVYNVTKVVAREGSYFSVLTDLMNKAKALLLARGTAMRPTATEGFNSGLNDLQTEIGNSGVQASWPFILDHLRQNGIRELDLRGKSLGGAQIQRVGQLMMKQPSLRLQQLTTFASVGVGEVAEEIFAAEVEANPRYHELPVWVIRLSGDAVPMIGGQHLGATVNASFLDLKVVYIHPTNENVVIPNPTLCALQLAATFVISMIRTHVHQITIEDFSYLLIEERSEIQRELLLGERLEGYRQMVSYRTTRSFTDFVQNHTFQPLFLGKEEEENSTTPIFQIGTVVILAMGLFSLFLSYRRRRCNESPSRKAWIGF